ncbi:hypothetical protein NCHU2750_06950 [Neorhizobium sp. NCHU2750]|nr:hypothetical protein NCHU2750_06950 [Neorhizobium sp. NCHU2750]
MVPVINIPGHVIGYRKPQIARYSIYGVEIDLIHLIDCHCDAPPSSCEVTLCYVHVRLWRKPAVAKSGIERETRVMLRPYWIKMDKPSGLGFGITAWSKEDAETLLRLVLPDDCAIISINPVKDAASLDQGHVIPNMGNMFRRGIWYPLGYQHLTN